MSSETELNANLREFLHRLQAFELRLKHDADLAGQLWQELLLLRPGLNVGPPAGTFPDCCPDYVFPSTLTLSDNVYGSFTLTFDGVSRYSGCKNINFAGTGTCAARNPMPLWYDLDVDGASCQATLTMSYVGSGGSNCPIASQTCANVPNVSFAATTGLPCSGGTMTFAVKGGFGPHPAAGTAIQTITLP